MRDLEGKLALVTSTGNFPSGSPASWREPPPQPLRARIATMAAIIPLLHTLHRLTAAATYHLAAELTPVPGAS